MSYPVNKLPSCIRRLARTLALLVWLPLFIAMPANASAGKSQSQKPTLRYDISGSSAWYPYFIPDAKQPGIVAELVSAVLTEANIIGVQVAMPPKRTLAALTRGDLDFDVSSPSWFPNNNVPEGFVLSEGLIEIKEYVVTLPQNARRFRITSDLNNQNIGTVRGYLYNNDKLFSRVDFISESKLIQALILGRIDAVIMGDLPAMYWARQSNTKIVLGPVNSAGDLHFRLRNQHAHLIPQINHAIKKLKQGGLVAKVVSQYLSVMPDTAQVTVNVRENPAD